MFPATGMLPVAAPRDFPAAIARGILAILLGCALFTPGCAPREENVAAPADRKFAVSLGDRTVHVELAVTQEETSRGLMFRESLEEDSGMLFVFRDPRRMSFYMLNTPIPLDIGYFSAAGILREVYALHPFDENIVPSQSARIQFALEMEQGWFSANGIRRGAQLDLEEVAAALRARGFPPEDFGLGE